MYLYVCMYLTHLPPLLCQNAIAKSVVIFQCYFRGVLGDPTLRVCVYARCTTETKTLNPVTKGSLIPPLNICIEQLISSMEVS